MRTFDYVRPDTLEEALALLRQHGTRAKLLAGGTDLIVRLRRRQVQPVVVVDVKRAARLRSDVVEVDSRLRIGANAVITDILADPRIRHHFPALVDAAAVVGSIQIRNRATLTGNVCNASPAADTAPALLVYGAIVNAISASSERAIPLADFFAGPGRTVLEAGEMVSSIDLPLPPQPTGAAFGRVTRRFGVDLAVINMCCAVTGSGETRMAFGAVGPRPLLVTDDTRTLASRSAPDAVRDDALQRLVAQATPVSDVRGSRDYRLAMLTAVGRRTIDAAIDRLQRSTSRS
jgi:CO/xanthine dehydrogenase FAD-binding subunit